MENKKTKIAIIIVILLIVMLIVVSYFYNDYNTNQLALLSKEANKILETDLTQNDIDFKIKTEKNYAKVEKAIKEHTSKLRNIYIEMEEMLSGINPNLIFSAQNMEDKNLEEIEKIIDEYKEKSQNLVAQCEELTNKEKIAENISEVQISSIRNGYYTGLYNEIMFSEAMQKQFYKLEEQVKNEKGRLYDKLNKIQKTKEFFESNESSWAIKDGKIQFTNLNKMTEYYNLVNQIID